MRKKYLYSIEKLVTKSQLVVRQRLLSLEKSLLLWSSLVHVELEKR